MTIRYYALVILLLLIASREIALASNVDTAAKKKSLSLDTASPAAATETFKSNASSQPGQANGSLTPSTDRQPGQPLKGSVKSRAIVAAEGLRQMGAALKKIERAAAGLVGEATRQDYVEVGDPDVVGSIIIPAIPDPSGMMPIGPYLPMRRNWFDFYLDEIAKLIPMYAEEVDALVLPDSIKQDSLNELEQMRPYFQQVRQSYLTLYNMQKDLANASNNKVAEQSVILHDSVIKIDKLRREIFKMLQEAEKREKDSKS